MNSPGWEEIMESTLRTLPIIVIMCALGVCAASAGSDRQCPDDAVLYDPATGMTAPEILTKVTPEYPGEARREKVTGTVVLDTTIDTDGAVVAVAVSESPDQRLDQAAMAALEQWRFRPAEDEQGLPIKVCYLVTIRFDLS